LFVCSLFVCLFRAINMGEAKCGSCSNPGTIVLAVLAVLTFIIAVALLVLVTRIRSLATQTMHLQQEARGNRRKQVQITGNRSAPPPGAI
jgi:hypothetical protein